MAKTREKKIAAPLKPVIEKLKRISKEPELEKTKTGATISDHLEQRFGLGSQPALRRALYRRLQLAVEVHGERALKPLQTVAAEAKGARKPDRYFCRAALCRLREMNLLEMESFG